MANEITPFVITELTGDKRVLTLQDRALPYRPFELSGNMRNTTTWYPGSPVGVIQVLGASENETTVNGMWKERFLAATLDGRSAPVDLDGTPVTDVKELTKQVDDFRRKGQLVKVTWLTKIRQGIISNFTQRWMTDKDVEWEITFTWISQGEVDFDLKVTTPPAISDIVDQVEARVEVITDLVDQARAKVAEVEQTVLENLRRMRAGLDAARETIAKSTDLILSPLESAQRMAAILNGMKDDALQTVSDMLALDGRISNAGERLGSTLEQLVTVRDAGRAASSLARESARNVGELRAALNPPLVRTFFATEGQDLRDVSTQFYATPDEWRTLKDFNDLQSSKLVAGQLVFVPANPERREPRVC